MAEQALDKQRPIQSALKSKCIRWREPESPTRWSFAKQLREKDKTRQVYLVNPYAKVYRFRDNPYGIYTESLDGMGDPWIYLLVRPQKALLVARADEFDGIFPGHGPVDLGSCDRVIADPQSYDSKMEVTFGGVARTRYNKMIYQSGYLNYSLSGV